MLYVKCQSVIGMETSKKEAKNTLLRSMKPQTFVVYKENNSMSKRSVTVRGGREGAGHLRGDQIFPDRKIAITSHRPSRAAMR